MKNKIIARNVHEEDGDHQQHDDVPHKDHSQEKHDHKDDKREDCQEHWEHFSYNDNDLEWGLRIEYSALEQLVSGDKIDTIILPFKISYVHLLHISEF